MNAAVRIRQLLGIVWQFIRIGVIRKSQFRVDFFIQVAMDTVWYASHILVFEILFAYTSAIAGWSVEQIRVFLGFLFVSDAFMMVWLGQSWHFGRDLKDGNLDPYRLRPYSTVFLYFFQRFSLEGMVNMLIASGYLLYAVGQAGLDGGPGLALRLAWGVALGWWGRWTLSVMFSVFEFYFVNSDAFRFADQVVSGTLDRPLDIFGRRVRQFLLFVVPAGALTHVPASILLGRYTLAEGLGHTLWFLALGLLALQAWKRGFRRYESAMS